MVMVIGTRHEFDTVSKVECRASRIQKRYSGWQPSSINTFRNGPILQILLFQHCLCNMLASSALNYYPVGTSVLMRANNPCYIARGAGGGCGLLCLPAALTGASCSRRQSLANVGVGGFPRQRVLGWRRVPAEDENSQVFGGNSSSRETSREKADPQRLTCALQT